MPLLGLEMKRLARCVFMPWAFMVVAMANDQNCTAQFGDTLVIRDGCDSVVVNYLNWDLRTRVGLGVEDVRNSSIQTASVHVIRQRSEIDSVTQALSIVELKWLMEVSGEDTRMVLDFYDNGLPYNTVQVNPYKQIFWNGGVYSSKAFWHLINDIVPPAPPR